MTPLARFSALACALASAAAAAPADPNMMTCAACSDIPMDGTCDVVGQQTSNPAQTSCYEAGDVFPEGALPAGDYCASGEATHNRDCERAHCRPSYACVASAISISECPLDSFVREMRYISSQIAWPVTSFDDCDCNYGLSHAYSDSEGQFRCFEDLRVYPRSNLRGSPPAPTPPPYIFSCGMCVSNGLELDTCNCGLCGSQCNSTASDCEEAPDRTRCVPPHPTHAPPPALSPM
jgi:hypothetical protein